MRLDTDALFARAIGVEVAGLRITTLCPDDHLLALAIHGTMHGWSVLRFISDIDAVAPQVVDWDAVLGRARSARMLRALSVALLLAGDLLGTELPADVAAICRRDREAAAVAESVAARLLIRPRSGIPSRGSCRFRIARATGCASRREVSCTSGFSSGRGTNGSGGGEDLSARDPSHRHTVAAGQLRRRSAPGGRCRTFARDRPRHRGGRCRRVGIVVRSARADGIGSLPRGAPFRWLSDRGGLKLLVRGTEVPRYVDLLLDRGTKVPRYASLHQNLLHVVRDFSPPGIHGFQSPGTTSLEGLEALAEEVNPDAVLYTPHFSSCAQQAAAIAERLRIPFLLWPAIHLDHARHTSRAARRFYRSAALVLCLSDVERDWLVRRAGLLPQQVVTLGYGWNGDATPRARAVIPTRPVRLLTVGAFARHKQLDHQLDALALLRGAFQVDARLTIAGALREPSVFERLRTRTRRRALEASVDFVTDCTDATIAELHAAADVFLFTSASESFGVALLEAIGCGTFPIAYPHPVYRGLIESSGFGLLAERSTPNALADAVGRALDARVTVSDQHRLRWLATRSWARITAPLAQALGSG